MTSTFTLETFLNSAYCGLNFSPTLVFRVHNQETLHKLEPNIFAAFMLYMKVQRDHPGDQPPVHLYIHTSSVLR